MPSSIATTVSVIAGGLLTLLGAWLTDLRLSRRDQKRWREERLERVVTRRNDFQRETLLALQDASQRLIRATGASLYEDIMASRASGEWQKASLTEKLSDDHLRFTTEMLLLATRILDDDTRRLAEAVRSSTSVVSASYNRSEAEARMAFAANVQQQLLQRTGEILRGLDAPD